MILYPMNEMMTCASSRYQLVNLVAYRARQLSTEAEVSGEYLTEKPVTLALNEAWAGAIPPVDNTQE